jgi:5-methylcytosine-specific restriction endonuclease McrA
VKGDTTVVNVLLLNASDEPLAVVSLKRAMGLMLADKVDLVRPVADRALRSAHREFPVPSVIRLRYFVSVPHRTVAWTRANVLKRDHYTCQYCGHKMTASEATIDHVVSQSRCKKMKINPNTWTNTVACCRKCQKRKGDKSMEETGLRFYNPNFEPKRPRVNYIVFALGNAPDEWKKYIRA